MKKVTLFFFVASCLLLGSTFAKADNALHYVVEHFDSVIAPKVDGLIVLHIIPPAGHTAEISVDPLFSEYTKLKINCPTPAAGQDPRVYIHIKPDTMDVGKHSLRIYVMQDLSDYVEFDADFEIKNLVTSKSLGTYVNGESLIPNHYFRVVLTQADGSLMENAKGVWQTITPPVKAWQSNVVLGNNDTWLFDSVNVYRYHQQHWTSHTWSSLNILPSDVVHLDVDASDRLCVLKKHGRCVIINDQVQRTFQIADTLATFVFADGSDNCWFASGKVLSHWQPGLNKQWIVDTTTSEVPISMVEDLAVDLKGKVWLGLSQRQLLDEYTIVCTLEHDTLLTFNKQSAGSVDRMRFIVTADSGVYLWRFIWPDGKDEPYCTFTEITYNETLWHTFYSTDFNNPKFVDIATDVYGNIWVYDGSTGEIVLLNKHGIQPDKTSGVNTESEAAHLISCSPNPSTTFITFHFPEQTQASVIVVRDVLGREYTQFVVPASGEIQLDVQTWPTGSYVCSDGRNALSFVVLH